VQYVEDGLELQEQGWPSLRRIRWQRGTHENGRWKDGGHTVRDEYGRLDGGNWIPEIWIWYDKNGAMRSEWDANGDGVPETYLRGDYYERKNMATRALPVEESWAVHPELIQPDCYVPGQALRRVPFRRIDWKDLPVTQEPEEFVPVETGPPRWVLVGLVGVIVLFVVLVAARRQGSGSAPPRAA
jgi:hypothetical protein